MAQTNSIGLSALILILLLGFSSLLVLLGVLLPGYAERARSTVRSHPGRSFLLGLVNLVFFLAMAALFQVPFVPLQVLAGLFLFLLLPILIVLGLLAASGLIGEHVWSHFTSKPGRLLAFLLIGNAVILLSLLVPIVGWLLFLGVLLTGIGAAIAALLTRDKVAAAE